LGKAALWPAPAGFARGRCCLRAGCRGIRLLFVGILQNPEELRRDRVAEPDTLAAGIELYAGFVGGMAVDRQDNGLLIPSPAYFAGSPPIWRKVHELPLYGLQT